MPRSNLPTHTNTHLIVISAPSGAGKTTLCQKLLKEFPMLVASVSTTTRLPRKNEHHGIDYFFITKNEFELAIQNHQFVEWALVHGNYYGTTRQFIENAFLKKQSVLLVIDVQGASLLQKSYPKECHRIFIAPPSLAELEARLRLRGTDTESSIQKRLANAALEMQASQNFDHIITNDSLERAYAQLKSVLENQYHLIPKKKN